MTFHVTAQRMQHYYESCDFDIVADDESEARAMAENYARDFGCWTWEEDVGDDGEITVLNVEANVEGPQMDLSNDTKTSITATQKEKRKTGMMPVDR